MPIRGKVDEYVSPKCFGVMGRMRLNDFTTNGAIIEGVGGSMIGSAVFNKRILLKTALLPLSDVRV